MSQRDRVILIVVLAVAAVAGSWLVVIQPRRDRAAKLQTQINAAQSQLGAVRAQMSQASAARAAFATSYTTLVRLGEAVPTDDNTPSLIYQLQGAAKAAGVDFQSLTFNAGGGSSPSSSTSTPLPPGATMGPAGFPVEPFTFTFQGNFFHLANFLGRLQRFVVAGNQHISVSGRLMTLNSISLGPASTGFPQMAATISATTYLLPSSQGLLNGATPAGPAPSSAQTVSTPTSSGPAPAVLAAPTVR